MGRMERGNKEGEERMGRIEGRERERGKEGGG